MAYKNLARIEADEKELEELEAEYRKQNGELSESNNNEVDVENPLTNPDNPPAITKDEEVWKKRHSDLRSYTSKQINDLNKKIEDLTKQLTEKDNDSNKFPANKQEAEEWVKEYPDLARVIGTLIDERASNAVNPLTEEVRNARLELEAERTAIARERAMTDVLKAHPDFLELRTQDDFKEWVESQPVVRGPRIGQALYDALYQNETDASAAIEAINIFKQDKKIKEPRKNDSRDNAAKIVSPSRVSSPDEHSGKRVFLESEIDKMKPWDFEKLEDEIEQARREGRITYDISGAAR